MVLQNLQPLFKCPHHTSLRTDDLFAWYSLIRLHSSGVSCVQETSCSTIHLQNTKTEIQSSQNARSNRSSGAKGTVVLFQVYTEDIFTPTYLHALQLTPNMQESTSERKRQTLKSLQETQCGKCGNCPIHANLARSATQRLSAVALPTERVSCAIRVLCHTGIEIDRVCTSA